MSGHVLKQVTRGLISFGTGKPLTQLDTEAANRDFAESRARLTSSRADQVEAAPRQQEEIAALARIALGDGPQADAAMTELMLANPDFGEKIREHLGIQSQEQADEIAKKASILLQIKDLEERNAAIRQMTKDEIDAGGRNAQNLLSLTDKSLEEQNLELRLGLAGALSPQQLIAAQQGRESKLGRNVVTQNPDTGEFSFATPVLGPGGTVTTQQTPIEGDVVSSQLGETSVRRQERDIVTAGGKTTSSGLAQRQLDLPQARARKASSENKLDRLERSAQRILDDDELWKVVGLGRGLSLIPSGAGARIRAEIDTLQSQSGLAVLQDMRDNSKTGAAVGQVSNFEQELFQNNIAPLANLNVSPEAYRQTVQDVVDFARESKARISNAFFLTYPELIEERDAAGPPDFSTMSKEQLERLAGGG